MIAMRVRVCPTCGHRTLKSVTEEFVVKIDGHRVSVPGVTRQRCLDCREEIFDHQANRMIDKFMLNNPHFLAARRRTLLKARGSGKSVAVAA